LYFGTTSGEEKKKEKRERKAKEACSQPPSKLKLTISHPDIYRHAKHLLVPFSL